ncbi:MAG: YggS family pyridoxal phosphate-dependent enzyme [Actinomycetes bacterium]
MDKPLTGDQAQTHRREQIRQGMHEIQQRIDAACALVGRDSSEVTTIVVTKTYPASDVSLLHELGVRDVGENRDQEASTKQAGLTDLALTWHCIGQVQTNKAKSIAAWADVVHSVDRPDLVKAFSRAASMRQAWLNHSQKLKVLIQVSLDADPDRGGCRWDQVLGLADAIAATQTLDLKGVMAVAPLGMDPKRAFADLQQISFDLAGQYPNAAWISAGMTGDFEAAITAGATHVRIGSAILGNRA